MRIITFLNIFLILVGIFMELPGADVKKKILPARFSPDILLPPDSDELAWRYDANIAAFCASPVYELNPEIIEWGIKNIKAQGFNVISIGINEDSQSSKWPRIVEYTKMFTELAHKNEMKVIFHHNVSVIRNITSYIKHPGWLAKDIKYGLPSFHYVCINNPEFKKVYQDKILDIVRNACVDAILLDEAWFLGGKEYCGCEHCRTLFTQKTGLTLPYNDDSDVFHNMNNPIWIAWLEWRKHSAGDWMIDIRKKLNTINLNISIQRYTTHYGFAYNWASNDLGFDIFTQARACDWLGTEIMSRNVYDSYRSVYALRKAFAGLGDSYNSPVHGWLYYLRDPVYAYFGWALNHMNRQTTIMSDPVEGGMDYYLKWPMKMNCRYVKSMSDVAVVFSHHSRDYGKILDHVYDVFGSSQSLTDAHIQHDIIMEGDLLDGQKLNKYKLLLLPCMGNMSEKEVDAVRQYVAIGGTLFVSGHTSLLDENGFEQPNFQLADVMGVDVINNNLYKRPTAFRMNTEEKIFSIPYPSMRVKLRNGAKALAEIIDKDGKAIYPAIVSNTYCKGQCLYISSALGGGE